MQNLTDPKDKYYRLLDFIIIAIIIGLSFILFLKFAGATWITTSFVNENIPSWQEVLAGDSGEMLYQSSGTVNSLETYIRNGSSSVLHSWIALKECDTGNYGTNSGYTNCIEKLRLYADIPVSSTGTLVIYTGSSTATSTTQYTLNGSKYYAFVVDNSTSWYEYWRQDQDGNSYAAGAGFGTWTTKDPWFKIGNYTAAPPSLSLSFIYPTTGTSTPLFNPWQLSATGINSSDTYDIRIQWYTIDPSGISSHWLYNRVVTSGASIASSGISITRIEYPFDFAQNQLMGASACIWSYTYNASSALACDTITFTLLSIPNSGGDLSQGGTYIITSSTGNGTYSVSTTTENAVLPKASNPDASSTRCTKPTDITDIGGGIYYALCSSLDFIIYPHQFSKDMLTQAFDQVQHQPPFAFAFGIFEDFNTAGLAVYNTTTSDLSITFNRTGALALVIPTSALKIIDNTEYANLEDDSSTGTNVHSLLYATEDTILTLLLLLIIFKVVTKGRKEYH